MNVHDHDRGRRDGAGVGPLSRRGFLGLAGGVAATGVGYAEFDSPAADPDVADTVLGKSDLVGREAYVEWRVDPARAPLPSHLRETVPSFSGEGAATGFVSDGTPGLPTSVESAVLVADDWPAVVDATTEWFARTHADPPTVTGRGSDRVAWHATTREGLVDAARLDRVGDVVAVTVVAGRPTGLDPRTAARRYGTAVRERAVR